MTTPIDECENFKLDSQLPVLITTSLLSPESLLVVPEFDVHYV